ncbi:TIGR02611 family protein [Corynebacterium halotolerans]|uniref:TIGR02611 family protein n=1 Tax=Corynebacterium halotolerans TaxID=225326 RepID=UPI003CE95714
MTTMREMVHVRVEKLRASHQQTKAARYGFLVRPLTLILGWTVLVVGVITIPLPGQGWLTTFIGVGILSLEQEWARRLLGWGVKLYDRFFAWYHRQPLLGRIAMITGLILVIWAIFLGIVIGWWHAGGLDVLTPVAQNMGMSR